MNKTRQCPSCGCEIDSDLPGGLCPECLLTAGLEAPGTGDPTPRSDESGGSTARLFVPPTPDSLMAHFPHLDILESLGHGGMGAVYKARQRKLDRLVALKILRPESADDPAFAERFNREARTLARLHHPHIVAVHDFGEVTLSGDADAGAARRLYYILMEYVDGVSLRQTIQSGELDTDQALVILAQICDALQFAHEAHVVHRDIKPENILVDSQGRVKIADFGLAKLMARSRDDFTLTATHQVMGTPRYMAPEQMEGSHLVDHRADIYALGVVFYEILTGQVPAGHFEPPSRIAHVDPRLDDIVFRALAREPHRRYQQVNDLRADICTVAGSAVNRTVERMTSSDASTRQAPAGNTMSEHDYEMLRLDARAPAGGLMLVGFLGAVFWIIMTLVLVPDSFMRHGELAGVIGGAIAAVIAGGFLTFAGLRMRNLEAYELCVAASILAILPWSPAALLGIPIGVWCLRTLRRPDIKSTFVWKVLQNRGLSDVPVPLPVPEPGHGGGGSNTPRNAYKSEMQERQDFPGPSTLIDQGVDAVGRWLRGS